MSPRDRGKPHFVILLQGTNRLHFDEIIPQSAIRTWSIDLVTLHSERNFSIKLTELTKNIKIATGVFFVRSSGVDENFEYVAYLLAYDPFRQPWIN
jgi:hypothetical protein